MRPVWQRQQAEQDNEQRHRLQIAAAVQEQSRNSSSSLAAGKNGAANNNPRRQQEAVITELRSRTKTVQEKKLLPADQVYHGALEDILNGLKSEPYRRADALRRSQRRRNNTNRMSRNIEDLEASF